MATLQVSYRENQILWWTDDFTEPDQPWHPLLNSPDARKTRLDIEGKKKAVPCQSSDIETAVDILLSLDLRQWNIGAGPKVLAHATRWALGLLSRGRWMPSLTQAKGTSLNLGFTAVFDAPEDLIRLEQLARMLPASVRAADPKLTSHDLIKQFTQNVLETLLQKDFKQEPCRYTAKWLKKILWPVDDWLLTIAQGKSESKFDEADELMRLYQRWTKDLNPIASQARMLLRLSLPEPGEGWHLKLFLQSTEDLSLQVPLPKAWSKPETLPEAFQSDDFSVQERILRDLARASKIFSPTNRALIGKVPKNVDLQEDEVEDFLRQGAWNLEEIGMAVQLPAELARPSKVKLKLAVKSSSSSKDSNPSLGLLGGDRLVEFDWSLALGDTPLTHAELQQLAEARRSLLQFRGEWVHLDQDHLKKALQTWNQGESQEADLLDVLKGSLATQLSELGAEVEFQGDLAALQDEHSLTIVEPPATLQASLRHYQERGYSWLRFLRERGLGACLADDMGLGKTIQTIASLLKEAEISDQTSHLLICPTSILGNWEKEIAKFAPSLSTYTHHGSARVQPKDLKKAIKGHHIVLTTYGIIQREVDPFKKIAWGGLILDEAHIIKNSRSKQSMAVRSLKGQFRLALTGTPIENRLTELWTLMDFLNPGLLGKRATFVREYVLPIERDGEIGPRQQLRQAVQPFLLRRLKSDPAIAPDLPAKEEIKMYCSLTAEQAALYKAQVDSMLELVESAEGIGRSGMVLSSLMRLKQVCNHPSLILDDDSPLPNRSGKLEQLEDMLGQLVATGDSSLVFTQFAGFAKRLAPYLQQRLRCEVLCLHGGTSRAQRDKLVEQFQNSNQPQVFVISIKAGGVGLNLTKASRVFHFDRWWNPSVENQATDRAFRIGQTQKVQVYKFICPGTLEERIDELIEKKAALADQVVGSGEAWLSELDNRQLREIVELGARV